jgi:hypothetical protein
VQEDDGAEAGSPIITKQALTKDLEYFGLIKKYKSAEEPERHRLIKKVRRAQLRTSSNDVSGDDNGGSLDSKIPHNAGEPTTEESDSDLELNFNLDDADEQERRLGEKRATWESTLPNTTTELDFKPIAKSGYTFIESDETPSKTYEQRHFERKQNKSSLRQRLPFR